MKKYCVTSLIAAAVIFTSVSAFAFPYYANEYNGVFFRNSEVLVDNDQSGTVSTGDVFWGVMSVQNIVAPTNIFGQTGPNIWQTGSVPQEITGYFATEVVGVVDQGGGLSTIVFSAAGANDPNGLLVGGEAVLIYEGNTVNYNDSTQALGLSTATDGSLAFSLGFADMSNYWYTPNLPGSAITAPGTAGPVGVSYAGLDFIQLPAFGFDDVNDPNESVVNTDVNFWFNSEIFDFGVFGTADGRTDFHFGSNDPAVFFPVPEPSTFVLLGAGILGFLVIGRKRGQK